MATRFLPLTVRLLVVRWCAGIQSSAVALGSLGVLGRGVGELATTAVEARRFLRLAAASLLLGKSMGAIKVE
jgi:hypothetical protein